MDRAAPARSGRPPPPALRRAALLVAVEGAGLALGGVAYAVGGLLGHPEDRLATVVAGALTLGAGLAVLLVARGLSASRGWAFSPTVVAQLFLVVVGVGLLQGRVWAVGAPLLLLAGLVLSQLAAPESRATFRDRG